jgi:hypothetical protein
MSNPIPLTAPAPAIETLSEEVCWAHLAAASIGRIAVMSGDGIDIFPVNFLARGRTVYFRSAPGNKMMDVTREPRIAFEADELEGTHRWSVVVRGSAARMSTEEEIFASGVLELQTLSPTEKWNFVAITATSITGRRFSLSGTH